MMPGKLFLCLFLILTGAYYGSPGSAAYVGVNIGTNVSNLPLSKDLVSLLKANKITHVRLYDASSSMLSALSNSTIDVMVSVTNDEIIEIGKSTEKAATWINKNVLSYTQLTNISAIAVGSEVLTSTNHTVASSLIHALNNLHTALIQCNLNDQIRVSTPHSMQTIINSFPPLTASFSPKLKSTMYQIIQFLKNTNSSFMLNAFPYHEYIQGKGVFPIEYALFQTLVPSKEIVDPNTHNHYNSMFEAMVDAAYYAMEALGFYEIPIIVTETGWPWSGGKDASLENAQTFVGNLTQRVLNGSGPPGHPSFPLNSYVYELLSEDKESERMNWGMLFPNGSAVYPFSFDSTSNENSSVGNSSLSFCVAKPNADVTDLKNALNWACGIGGADCRSIQYRKSCYFPDTLQAHASFAFNDYYNKKRFSNGTCNFEGTATLVKKDPSSGSCIYTGSSKNKSAPPMPRPKNSLPVNVSKGDSKLRVPKIVLLIVAVCIASIFL